MNVKFDYTLEFKVRDYECDIQGIVNNSVYQNYLEHTRHEYILSKGLSFTKLHEEGIDLVVARIEMAYKKPLKSGDRFISCLNIRKDGIKYMFDQAIYELNSNALCLKATITAVGLTNGKIGAVAAVDGLFVR